MTDVLTDLTDVLIVGAGPAGLLLATELRLAGVDTVLVERSATRPGFCRGYNLNARALDLLSRRGLAERFIAEGWQVPHAAFGGLPVTLSLAGTHTDHPFSLGIPQTRVEEVLEQHALHLGTDLRRGHDLRTLHQDADGVTATVAAADGEYRIRARYLVGCDGGRSTVRKQAGIAFPGTAATRVVLLADVECDLPYGVTDGVMVIPRPGYSRVLVADEDRAAPLTLELVQTAVDKALGRHVELRNPRWLTRFGDAVRQAAEYVHGRVVLAGDAAHIHPPAGAIGVNVALDDAFNLGWKLAATVHGTAPDGLLASYHTERHAAGVQLLASTQAQALLGDGDGGPLRDLMTRVAHHPAGNKAFAEVITGLDTRYPTAAGGNHPWLGLLAPDLALTTSTGPTTLATLLGPGRSVLLDLDGGLRRGLRAGCPDHPGLSGLLVRPDGHVAWIGTTGTDGLDAALDRLPTQAF
ncbi:FAD-dependent monooxygenase [Actinoplanes sp. N902-109]|uniref:FAD-dependent monooxygenase n=1 Tax=Actinoplanes sp. (strain N902-109) TaxID=649831 RepID=UPI000329566D|nr:FAD-dependent monooxygenase [Actinoplanes sp. N902-109]AGL15925.1 FAD-dependent oxidoreductase [Actinoplanes sp. N902-109]